MTVTLTQLYAHLSEKLDKDTAETLTSYIEQKIENSSASNIRELATKDFVGKEISNAKSDIIKWMFIFWIGQVAVTLAIIYFRK